MLSVYVLRSYVEEEENNNMKGCAQSEGETNKKGFGEIVVGAQIQRCFSLSRLFP